MRYFISLYCLLLTTFALAQKNEIFINIQPRSIKFDVSFNVRMKNDKGEIIGIRNLMNIPDCLKKVVDSCENKDELAIYLKKELNDGKYDWEANILLYYITQEDCLNMFPYEPDKVNLWLKKEKENCMRHWNGQRPRINP